MQQMRSKVQKYLAVDISHQMLNFAKNNQRDIQDIQRQYIQSDFDFIQNIIPYKNKSSLIMIL
jgi:23S rRNA G2445 N2-methylase RlmL